MCFVERQDVVEICLHFSAADQHEVEYENQHENIDRKTADPFHQQLSDLRNPCGQFDEVIGYQQVVAGFLFDQLGDVLGRFDDRSGIQVDALQLVDHEPYDQRHRDQETEDRFAQYDGCGQTAPYVAFFSQ